MHSRSRCMDHPCQSCVLRQLMGALIADRRKVTSGFDACILFWRIIWDAVHELWGAGRRSLSLVYSLRGGTAQNAPSMPLLAMSSKMSSVLSASRSQGCMRSPLSASSAVEAGAWMPAKRSRKSLGCLLLGGAVGCVELSEDVDGDLARKSAGCVVAVAMAACAGNAAQKCVNLQLGSLQLVRLKRMQGVLLPCLSCKCWPRACRL